MLLLRTLILTLFVSLPATASVMENEQSVFELSVNVKTLLLKYYHVQADEGNPQLVDELLSHRDSVLAEKNAVIAALPAQYSLEGSAVNEHWDEFDRLLNQNITEIRESNYPELQVVTLMREAQRSLLDDLSLISEKMQIYSETNLSEMVLWERRQKNLLLDVVERYIERAASSMGAPLTIDSVDIASLCKQFERGITELQSKASTPETQRLLSKIRSQWLFIETAATDDGARLVPFLVMRYTDSILNRLESVTL